MRPVISSLWIGKRLSYIEQLCLKSFADHGHRVKLYSYEEIENIPEGVEPADGRDILPNLDIIMNKSRSSPATSADRFRYHMLAKTDEIWVDADAYCLRPFPNLNYVFASDTGKSFANGVLRLPHDSRTLRELIDFCEIEYPVLPEDWKYYKPSNKELFMSKGGNGRVHISELYWGIWGPHALTYFLQRNNEARFSWRPFSLYPFSARQAIGLAMTDDSRLMRVPVNCYSIHFFGSNLRKVLARPKVFKKGLPQPGSFLAMRLIDHGIDPEKAPIIPYKENA